MARGTCIGRRKIFMFSGDTEMTSPPIVMWNKSFSVNILQVLSKIKIGQLLRVFSRVSWVGSFVCGSTDFPQLR